MMPLLMATPGKEYVVDSISGKEEVRKLLHNLGLVQGSQVTVVQAVDGNVIVSVKDARVAIAKEMAAKILVHQ